MSKKDFPPDGFKQTEIGLIPEEWSLELIGNLADIKYGKANPKSSGKFSVVGSGGVYAWTDTPLVSYPTLVIGRKGTAGSVQIFEHGCYPADTTFYLDWKTEVNVRFLYFYLLANPLSGEHAKTTLPSLKRSDLENLPVPLPPLPEQRAIAHVLSKIQATAQAQAAIAERARELKRALMAKLFTEGLRGEPLKETEIGPMPESWEVVELGQIADIVYGAQAAVAHATDPSIGTPILTNINISNDGHLDLATLRYYKVPDSKRDRLILKKGDVLFNWRSGSQEHVGKTALFSLDGEYTFSSFILRFRPFERVESPFLFRYLQYIKSQGFFARNRQQSSVNSVFNSSVAAKIPISVPLLDEQREIARILQTVDAKIVAVERKRAGLEELFRAMLGELMMGRVRVKRVIS